MLQDERHYGTGPAPPGSPRLAAIFSPECHLHGRGRSENTENDAAGAAVGAVQSHSHPNPEELIAGKRLLFLVGGPRSGTTWLQLLLSRSPRIATANETHLFTAYTPSLFSAWEHHQQNVRRLGLHNLMHEDEYFAFIKYFACSVMARIAERNLRADIILEKTPDHVLYWQSILKTFPEALFLHIVRDPRSVVASLCAAGAGWGVQWASREVLENCETWIKYVKKSQGLKATSNNFLQIRYEDLWQHGEETLLSVFSWLGVDISPQECSQYLSECDIDNLRNNRLTGAPWDLTTEPKDFYRKGGTETWRDELTAREVYLIEHLTHELMREFGYAPVSTRRKFILPLIVASRIRTGIAWRLQARRANRDNQ